MKQLILALAALASLTGAATAAAPAANFGKEASIPFVNHRGIRDFQAVGRNTIFIQDQLRRWYRGTTFGPCTELPWATAIGVSTRGAASLDRFGTLIVRGERCPLQSLVRVEGPPPKKKKPGAA